MDLDKIGAEATKIGSIGEDDAWKMIALIRKQEVALKESQELVEAQVRTIDALSTPAAPAAPVVTVDTPEFDSLLDAYSASELSDYQQVRASLIAHIDAHTAQAVEAALHDHNNDAALRHIDAKIEKIIEEVGTLASDWKAAPQQHAQAALSDDDLYKQITSIIFERYPRIKGAYCASIAYGLIDFFRQQPAAAPKGHQNCHKCHGNSITHASFCPLFDSRQEQAALAQSSAATPPTPPQEAAARDDLLKDALAIIEARMCSECNDVTCCMPASRKVRDGLRAALAAPAAQVAVPEGWRVVEKKTHYALCEGNTVVASLTGPDATENAAIIAVAIESARTVISARHAAPSPAQPAPGADAAQGESDTALINRLMLPADHGHLELVKAARQQGRAAGIEEAAKVCEFQQNKWREFNKGKYVEDKTSADEMADDCIAAIRALNKQEPTA